MYPLFTSNKLGKCERLNLDRAISCSQQPETFIVVNVWDVNKLKAFNLGLVLNENLNCISFYFIYSYICDPACQGYISQNVYII